MYACVGSWSPDFDPLGQELPSGMIHHVGAENQPQVLERQARKY